MPWEAKINLFLMINVTVRVKLRQLYSESQAPLAARGRGWVDEGQRSQPPSQPVPMRQSIFNIRPTCAELLPQAGFVALGSGSALAKQEDRGEEERKVHSSSEEPSVHILAPSVAV